jgi:hypothetical protein
MPVCVCVCVCAQVEHPDFPEKPNVQRLECHLAGFFIQPHSNPKKSTIESISMVRAHV